MLERALPNKHLTEVALNHNYSGLNWIIVLEYICCHLQRSLQITSSGGSAYILRSPWAVVWREWPGWGQKLHLSRRGRLSNRLHRHLCRQSRQLPDPASWLRECVPVEWSDLQWPLLSGAERRTSTVVLVVLSLSLFQTISLNHILLSLRCTSRPREPPASFYPSAETNIRMLLWYWEGLTARGRHHSSTSPSWWWARATLCTGAVRHPERSSCLSSTLTSE